MTTIDQTPLTDGTWLLEASAGTGKTWQITQLVLRLLTEVEPRVRMGEIVIVTFTRAATAELKDRVRTRLSAAASALATGTSDDDALNELVARSGDQRADWLIRLREAQEEFDQALISTIHGFCQRMLEHNAFESGADFGAALEGDNSVLLDEIVDDWMSAEVNAAPPDRYAFLVGECGVTREGLAKLAKKATDDPDMRLVDEPTPALPADFAKRCGALADAWEAGWEEDIAVALEESADLKANPPARVLFVRNNTYRRKKLCTEMGPLLVEWLRAAAATGSPEDPDAKVANYFSDAALEAKLVSGCSFSHPAWDEAVALVQDGCRVAQALESKRLSAPWMAFAEHVRTELDRRQQQRQQLAFHDLLRHLRLALPAPDEAPNALVDAIATRYRAALIDEFQDTDRLQWEIFQTLFGRGHHLLTIIGDPKQSIYGFRGANVHVYTRAKQQAAEQFTLDRNFRSDNRYVAALNAVMGQGKESLFGDAAIGYEAVVAAQTEDRLLPPAGWSASSAAPLQIGFASREVKPGETHEAISKTALNGLLPDRVAIDVVAFLDAGWKIRKGDDWRPVGPGDIAVLVRTGKAARAVHRALLGARVPAVLPGAESVYASDEARDLQWWLEAVLRGGDDGAARTAATSALFGWTADDLLALDQADDAGTGETRPVVARWDRWLADLSRWRDTLDQGGLLRTFRSAMERWAVIEQLMRWPDGERRLTNLLHVLELAHAEQTGSHLGLAGVIRWLAEQRADAGTSGGTEDEAAELRLETDADAVRVLTMHKSKGLQFPIVWAPYLWDGSGLRKADIDHLVAPAPGVPDQRVLDVRLKPFPPSKQEALARAEREAAKEAVRLLYVALTRAKHRCVVYTAAASIDRPGGVCESSVGLLLHSLVPGESDPGPDERFERAPARIKALGPTGMRTGLDGWAEAARRPDGDPLVGVFDAVLGVEVPTWTPAGDPEAAAALVAGEFGRAGDPLAGLDRTWRRLSYTWLARVRSTEGAAPTAAAPADVGLDGRDHDRHIDGDGEEGEERHGLAGALPAPDPDESEVPLAAFPPGADAGTFLHKVFELLDFQQVPREPGDEAADEAGRAAVAEVLDALGPRYGFERPDHREMLLDSIPRVLQTPLGGELGDLRLADLPRQRRLNELDFDLPVAGGDLHRRPDLGGEVAWPDTVSGRQFGEAFGLASGLEPAYVAELAAGWSDRWLAGYLTGSIDLVFATPFDGQPERFWVADYKSNRLDLLFERQHPPRHFCRAWMRHEMQHHDYVVQYHLYVLALHRYLRGRLADYDYDRHVGGACYLFIRGMLGPGTVREGAYTRGVFIARPGRAVIERLDTLLDAGGGR